MLDNRERLAGAWMADAALRSGILRSGGRGARNCFTVEEALGYQRAIILPLWAKNKR